LLASVGGFLDAYTFVGRGGVFANAQTGNIVLLGVAAGERHWPAALLHVPPILAFMLGIALAETLARPATRRIVRRPARFVLVAEIVVLIVVGALPRLVPVRSPAAAACSTADCNSLVLPNPARGPRPPGTSPRRAWRGGQQLADQRELAFSAPQRRRPTRDQFAEPADDEPAGDIS
jgi:hypothetical protein